MKYVIKYRILYLFLLLGNFIVQYAYCVTASFISDIEKFPVEKEFHLDLEIRFSKEQVSALRGAPELKLPPEILQIKVESFSQSTDASNVIYYRYFLKGTKTGTYNIGPAIVTYFTKTDPKSNNDEKLSLADITKKVVKGPKVLDTHSYVVQEKTCEFYVPTYQWLIYLLVALLILFAIVFVLLKVRKNNKKTEENIAEIKQTDLNAAEKFYQEGNFLAVYSELYIVLKQLRKEGVFDLSSKIENIKYAGYKPDPKEVEIDMRKVRMFLKNNDV